MQVFDQVDEKSEREASLLDRTVRVLEDRPEFPDLRHDIPLLGLGTREPVIVSVLIEGHIHVMPGAAPFHVPPMIVGPQGGGGERLARFQQRRDGRLRLRIQVPFGQPAGEAVAERSPRRGGRRSLEQEYHGHYWSRQSSHISILPGLEKRRRNQAQSNGSNQ